MPCSEGVFIESCGRREGVDDIYQAPPQLVVGRTGGLRSNPDQVVPGRHTGGRPLDLHEDRPQPTPYPVAYHRRTNRSWNGVSHPDHVARVG